MQKFLPALSVMGVLVAACGDRTPPVIEDVAVVAPNSSAPLAAMLSVATNEPVRGRVVVSGGMDVVA